MKNGQCPKCGSRHVYANTNRKSIPLNTITVGAQKASNRYAFLDTYVCTTCGYVENYLSKTQDLSYVQEKWALVEITSDNEVLRSGQRYLVE
ncbi:hypothetical protein [Lyngbya aestuarii]|uniref:hypothetical protein n=1 Tax=Lyngbya aestuarii TaxID=118322 RepID=UPI00403E340B